ncbi:hypothetical protein GGR50DRAFT_449546 [Xylaria sp. CBS 124048]|nr:hypothetical protein GGR50DRAFT_449546 [Xylaria sp. CBS 124048]
MSRTSIWNTITKREIAMRYANDLPLKRISIDELVALPSIHPAVISLVQELSTLQLGAGVLPGALRSLLKSQESIVDPLIDDMFMSVTTAAAESDLADLMYQHRRILRICKSSAQCSDEARPVYEAEWNDKVCAPMLELALEADRDLEESLIFHNTKDARITPLFEDDNAVLQNNTVDYGIFATPAVMSRPLAQLNALDDFEIDRPLVIAIETSDGDGNAPSQLANFARAHFRAVRYLLSASNQMANSSRGVSPVIRASSVTKPVTGPPMLPLIEVSGSSWQVSFAVLDGSKVLVSSDLPIGSTERLSRCYVLLHSLLRLARWARSEYTEWWTAQLQASQGQATLDGSKYLRESGELVERC